MRLIAHRGFGGIHPENTVRAVRAAAEVADLVEVDVRRCGSGELVVVHDATVDRVTDGTGRVAELSLDELRDLDVLDSGEPIPTLSEVLAAVPRDVGLVLDVREPETAADVATLVDGADVEGLLSSFHEAALADVRSAAPEVSRAYLFETSPRAGLSTALDADCVAVHPHHELCTEPLVRRAHLAGLSVHGWTVADAATAERLATAGVDGVFADYPDVLGSS